MLKSISNISNKEVRMKCALCSNEIQEENKLIGPYTIHQPNIHGTEEGGSIEVCGRCYLLTSILDVLKEIKDGNN